jgi:predicted acylesterase/phospholipase RssA
MKVRKSRNFRLLLCLLGAGCSTWAYQNEPLVEAPAGKTPPAAPPVRATFDLDDSKRMKEDVVVCLALSGGGSRAAWFSSAVMFELAKIETDPDLLAQVDVISSVSGGSLAAAYFASSQDPAPRALLSAPPRAALPQCADAKLEYDAKTRLLTVKGAMTDDEGQKLRAACDPTDAKRIDRLVVASRGCVSNRDWDHATVRDLMTRNYVRKLFWNFFWPHNIALYWTTAYDRGDIMAETFADNLFDRKKFGTSYGTSLTFADLNPVRPCLILNSTDGTDDPKPVDAAGKPREQGRGFGDVFAFTRETFQDELASDISKFPLAYAVMSSASFPGAFPYRTMRNFKVKPPHDPSYEHVFDGGNSDNLGLSSVKEVIRKRETARGAGKTTYVVICVDSYTEPRGARPRDADPRSAVDYVVDTDFLDAIDMLLKLNRYHLLATFMSEEQQTALTKKANADADRRKPGRVRGVQNDQKQIEKQTRRAPTKGRSSLDPEWEPSDLGDHLVFWHLTFRDLYDYGEHHELWRNLNAIPTDFKIDDEQADDLEKAAKLLVERDPKMVERIRSLLAPR